MQFGMIGLGGMEGKSVRRLLRSGRSALAVAAEAVLAKVLEPQQHKSAARQSVPDIVKPKATGS
jgi:6-phosphogluconate dehydrogenase (decarboxylating)